MNNEVASLMNNEKLMKIFAWRKSTKIIHYSLFTIHHSLSIIHYPLSIIHYPLSIISPAMLYHHP